MIRSDYLKIYVLRMTHQRVRERTDPCAAERHASIKRMQDVPSPTAQMNPPRRACARCAVLRPAEPRAQPSAPLPAVFAGVWGMQRPSWGSRGMGSPGRVRGAAPANNSVACSSAEWARTGCGAQRPQTTASHAWRKMGREPGAAPAATPRAPASAQPTGLRMKPQPATPNPRAWVQKQHLVCAKILPMHHYLYKSYAGAWERTIKNPVPFRKEHGISYSHWCRRRDSNPYGVAPIGF